MRRDFNTVPYGEVNISNLSSWKVSFTLTFQVRFKRHLPRTETKHLTRRECLAVIKMRQPFDLELAEILAGHLEKGLGKGGSPSQPA